jgi:hypothetical protein
MHNHHSCTVCTHTDPNWRGPPAKLAQHSLLHSTSASRPQRLTGPPFDTHTTSTPPRTDEVQPLHPWWVGRPAHAPGLCAAPKPVHAKTYQSTRYKTPPCSPHQLWRAAPTITRKVHRCQPAQSGLVQPGQLCRKSNALPWHPNSLYQDIAARKEQTPSPGHAVCWSCCNTYALQPGRAGHSCAPVCTKTAVQVLQHTAAHNG